jgi:hypothetical protein
MSPKVGSKKMETRVEFHKYEISYLSGKVSKQLWYEMVRLSMISLKNPFSWRKMSRMGM